MLNWFRRRAQSPRATPEPSSDADGALTPAFLADLATMRAEAEAGDPEAMANLGVHLHQQGLLAEAITWTERAWQAGNVTAAFNLGGFHERAGDTHLADLIWTKAAQLGDADAMTCVARLALRRGDRAAADRWLPGLLAQDQPYPITALGVAYREHGDDATALRVFERAIALGDAYAMEYAARIHQSNGDIAAATALRRQAESSHRFGWGVVETG